MIKEIYHIDKQSKHLLKSNIFMIFLYELQKKLYQILLWSEVTKNGTTQTESIPPSEDIALSDLT